METELVKRQRECWIGVLANNQGKRDFRFVLISIDFRLSLVAKKCALLQNEWLISRSMNNGFGTSESCYTLSFFGQFLSTPIILSYKWRQRKLVADVDVTVLISESLRCYMVHNSVYTRNMSTKPILSTSFWKKSSMQSSPRAILCTV